MNAFHRTSHLMAETLAPGWRIVTGPIVGSLLGPEWIVFANDKYFRVGSLTIGQLKRGVPAEELDMLECDDNGEPL